MSRVTLLIDNHSVIIFHFTITSMDSSIDTSVFEVLVCGVLSTFFPRKSTVIEITMAIEIRDTIIEMITSLRIFLCNSLGVRGATYAIITPPEIKTVSQITQIFTTNIEGLLLYFLNKMVFYTKNKRVFL